jgi:hypothetical protein
MVHDTYRAAFKKAKLDFVLAQKELGETNKRKAELETRIASLRETVIALGRMCGEEFDEADALGLTEAIRQTFMASPNVMMTAQSVRDRLEALGFNVTKYGNALASIHTVITRLEKKGDIKESGAIGDKTAYRWVNRYTLEPIPTTFDTPGEGASLEESVPTEPPGDEIENGLDIWKGMKKRRRSDN